MSNGTLEVIIVEGRHLKSRDVMNENDAYIEIYMNNKYKTRTTLVPNSTHPIWNERFIFNLHKNEKIIHFDLYDTNDVERDLIGNAKIKLKHVFDNGKFGEWVKLPGYFGLSSHGEIHIIMRFIGSH
jgi:Ca2+-dependent lipid-binding protein